MKLALNRESAVALRKLADSIPETISAITDNITALIRVYESVSEHLGSHRADFYLMLLHVQKAQALSINAIEILPQMMCNIADKIEAYLNLHNSFAPDTNSLSSAADVSDIPMLKSSGEIDFNEDKKLLSGKEILEKFGVAPCGNGTDVFVKGEHFNQFQQIYEAAENFPMNTFDIPVEMEISPDLIEGIHLGKSEAENPAIFWQQHKRESGTAESFQAIASLIPKVKERIAEGSVLSDLENDSLLSECVGIYFINKPEVIKCNGYYEFSGNGRHRILAARALGYDIPVKIIGERT